MVRNILFWAIPGPMGEAQIKSSCIYMNMSMAASQTQRKDGPA